MLVDSHAHLNFKAYNKDRSDVITRCLQNNMKVINVGSQLPTSQKAVELALQNPDAMYAAVGFHPVHSEKIEYDLAAFRDLIEKNRKAIVAVGEIGLDYYRLEANTEEDEQKIKEDQKELFKIQYQLAQDNNLPVIVHCRDAYDDLINLCQEISDQHIGVVHCFLGDVAIADKFLQQGFLLGFTGIITFGDDEKLKEVIEHVPLKKMLIETDAPYLSPVPFRGKRNEPLFVQYVAEKIAEIKGISKDKVVEQTAGNASQLFQLG